MHIPIALFIVGMIVCIALVWKLNTKPVEKNTTKFTDDEMIELNTVLADWTEMNDLRRLNEKGSRESLNRLYSPARLKEIGYTDDFINAKPTEHEQNLTKLEDTVEAFRRKC